MKQTLLYIALAIMVGCAKEVTTAPPSTDGAICFTAGVVSTRVSSSDDCAWAADGSDKVGIFSDPGGSNVRYTITDAASGAMTGDNFYPLASGARTYYAYHPYSDNLEEATLIEVDCTTPLLWATATSNDVEVALLFSHQLAKVVFNLTPGSTDAPTLDYATAWLVGANAEAKFDVMSGEFSDQVTGDITLTIDNGVITTYLPPMSGVAEDVRLWVHASNNTFVYSFDTSEWASGGSYEYGITVGETNTY